jgi:hypothetical protein
VNIFKAIQVSGPLLFPEYNYNVRVYTITITDDTFFYLLQFHVCNYEIGLEDSITKDDKGLPKDEELLLHIGSNYLWQLNGVGVIHSTCKRSTEIYKSLTTKTKHK